MPLYDGTSGKMWETANDTLDNLDVYLKVEFSLSWINELHFPKQRNLILDDCQK
jgi:hypothetical protein